MSNVFKNWFLALTVLLVSGWTHAQVLHTFTQANSYATKNDFMACGVGPCQNFSLAMGVSGSFTTASPLAPNLVNFHLVPLVTSFSFTDGLTNYANGDAQARVPRLDVSTDANGVITNVYIVLQRFETGTSPHVVGDRVSMLTVDSSTGGAYRNAYCGGVGLSWNGVADTCTDVQIDPGTSTADNSTVTRQSLNSQAVPTLSEWALLAMTFLMALAGMFMYRNRNSSQSLT